MKHKHSIFGLLFGIVWQIAFAEGFLLIVRHFLSEDPEALAKYPIVRIVMYVFWAPFMLKNVLDYLKEWKAESAQNKAWKTAQEATEKAAKEARQRLQEKADAEKTKEAREQAELERERAERDRQNREWQERTTKEQRRQNAERDRKRQEEADRKRAEQARKEQEAAERQKRQDKIAEKYWYAENDPKKLREAYDEAQERERKIGDAYRKAGNFDSALENTFGWIEKGAETTVNVVAEYDKTGATKVVKIIRDLIKPTLVDGVESLSRGDYTGMLKNILTGPAKGVINTAQNLMPTGLENANVVLESAKVRADLWRRGVTDETEIRNAIEQAVKARNVYEKTGVVTRTIGKLTGMGSESAEAMGNAVKEVTSNLYTNDKVTEYVANQQAKRTTKTPTPSKFITDLQSKIRELKQTKRKVDLR